MSKITKIVYEPGELDRTRKNLGDIEAEEARRMAALLGGEVGIERLTPSQRRARQAGGEKAGRTVPDSLPDRRQTGRNLSWAGEPEGDEAEGPGSSPETGSLEPLEQPWLLRVRIDFLSARPEYLLKTQFQALTSLFRFRPGGKDPVNPEFVNAYCYQASSLVEKLVDSLAVLLPPKRVELWERLRKNSPYHYAILRRVAGWKARSIADALASLKGSKEAPNLQDLLPLMRPLLAPLFQLNAVIDGLDFTSAAATAFSIAREADPAREEAFSAAREELGAAMDKLRSGLPYRWYPAMMRFCADRMYEYSDFYANCRGRVYRLLGMSESDVLRPPPPSPAATEIPPAEEPQEEPAEREEQPEPEAPSPNVIPPSVRAGLEVLDRLFPEAGMDSLPDYPDIFPYFNQVYSLPRGLDLVSPSDPLCQAVVLAHVLDDLFHGLRKARFGVTQDEQVVDLGEAIPTLIEEWSSSWQDILVKSYLPLLSDYCRLIETERESRSSPYAARKEADLHLHKKRAFFPFLSGTALSSSQAIRGKPEAVPFHKVVSTFRHYLTGVAQDIDRAFRAKAEGEKTVSTSTIANPLDPAVFEVENAVSKRVRQLLKYEGPSPRKFTNAALIYYTLSVLTVLDFLLNDQRSWAYGSSDALPYRPLNGGPAPYVDKMEKGPDYVFALKIEQLSILRSKKEAEARAANASAALGLKLARDAEGDAGAIGPEPGEAPTPGTPESEAGSPEDRP